MKNGTIKRPSDGSLWLCKPPPGELIEHGRPVDKIPRGIILPWRGPVLLSSFSTAVICTQKIDYSSSNEKQRLSFKKNWINEEFGKTEKGSCKTQQTGILFSFNHSDNL